MSDVFLCSPREIRRHVSRCIQVRNVPFVTSSPAMGKSAIMRSIAEEWNLKLIDHRLSTSVPEDLTGLPRFRDVLDADGNVIRTYAEFVPFETFPIEGTPLPINPRTNQPYDGWMLFLDEFNSAKKEVQAAAYKLVLDKMVGLKPLHPNVVITGAGNKSTDRAIVNPIGTAMQSRLTHLEMHLDPNKISEFFEDVAYKYSWDPRIIAYLAYSPKSLYDFRPDHNDKTFCSPRTWEFVNNDIRGVDYKIITRDSGTSYYEMEDDAARIAGNITSGEATKFIQFTKVANTIPKIDDIMRDPLGTLVPRDQASKFMVVTMLQQHISEKTIESICDYLENFPAEFRVLFFRGLKIQKPEYMTHKAIRRAVVAISRYLHDDAPVETAA